MFHPSGTASTSFFNDAATTEIYTLSLHAALPIVTARRQAGEAGAGGPLRAGGAGRAAGAGAPGGDGRRVVGGAAHRGAARAGRADLRRREPARDAGLRGGAVRLAVPRVVSLSLLVLVVASGACQKRAAPVVVAMEPRPNPPVGASAPKPPEDPRERLRRNRWLAQFWEELTPAQRRRVEARMRRAQPPLASNRESAGLAWDALGLPERDRLVFG